jgi:S-DNA-T family DNA segregation ATPase FtsK/SpoIIIE
VAQNPQEAAEMAQELLAKVEGGKLKPSELAIIIEGINDFDGSEADFPLSSLVKAAVREEQCVIGEAEASAWGQAYNLSQPFKSGKRGLLLAPGDMDGDMLLGTPLGRLRRADFPAGRGFYIQAGRATKVQVAMAEV